MEAVRENVLLLVCADSQFPPVVLIVGTNTLVMFVPFVPVTTTTLFAVAPGPEIVRATVLGLKMRL